MIRTRLPIALIGFLSAAGAMRAEAQCPASCSTSGTAGSFTNTTTDAPALLGTNSYPAEWWQPPGVGVKGGGGIGVLGVGHSVGVRGEGITGVVAVSTSATGLQASGSNDGVYATSTASNPASFSAVHGVATNVSGVFGQSSASNGVFGKSTSTGASAVYAENFSGGGYGVAGRVSGSGSGIAVLGDSANSGTAYAGYFAGRVYVQGYLNKAGGGFLIDHPGDPDGYMLNHSFVESPEMKNVYDGVVLTDRNGEAWIELPKYFGKLNKDFRYQLTCIGASAPIYVAEEIRENRFKVAGARPQMKVSWQVTGVRQDPWALANDPGVEIPKAAENRGKYLTPEVYGFKEDRRIAPGNLSKR